MALIEKLFGKKEKTLSERSTAELRREEILLTKDRDKLFKKVEQIATDKQKIFQQGATQKSPELRKALAMQFELKTQEQLLAGRQLNVRSKELLTVSRVKMMKENAPKMSGAMGRLNLTEKDVSKIASWIEDESVTQDMYNERLDEILGLGAASDKDALERAGLSSTGHELMNDWNDMHPAAVKTTLERKLVRIKTAMLIQQEAVASRQFAESMGLMAKEIGQTFKEMDLTKTQADWERAVAQAGSVEEKMDVFLDSMEQSAISGGVSSAREDIVSDEEIDRMIQADVLAQEKTELGKLDELESEIAKELGATKQKD